MRRLLAAFCGVVALGAVGGSVAQGAVPDLTGSWRNKDDPSSVPPWSLTASNSRQTLDATWHGSAAQGHPDLRGSFHTTLMGSGGSSFYKGPYKIDEDTVHAGGTITVTIETSNRIEFSLQSDKGGAPAKYTFIRVRQKATIPAPVIAPAPSAFDQTVAATAPPPGGVALAESPALGNARSVTATTGGLTVEDIQLIAGLRHTCYARFVGSLLGKSRERKVYSVATNSYYTDIEADLEPDLPAALSELASCVAFVDALESAVSQASAAAVDAAASCRGLGVKVVKSGRRLKTRPIRAPLRVRCKRVAGGLAVTYSTRSHKPLRQVVGSRLRVAVLRGRKDPAGGQLSFTYHEG